MDYPNPTGPSADPLINMQKGSEPIFDGVNQGTKWIILAYPPLV